jgi:hypothetical protein
MNLKDITEAELLSLLDKTIKEQYAFLMEFELLNSNVPCAGDFESFESLADLAERLTKEASKDWKNFNITLQKVWQDWSRTSWAERKKSGETKKHVSSFRFWLSRANSIHVIVAALLALKRGE